MSQTRANILGPTRTHLDILRDVLRILEDDPPIYERDRDRGYRCGACGFDLGRAACNNKTSEHTTHQNHFTNLLCPWIRAVAELEAWIRVEEEIQSKEEDL